MAQNEPHWDEVGLVGLGREQRKREFAEAYRKHIEAGDLFYPYVDYPYIEWFSESNGRVVLELDPSQVEILGGAASVAEKTPREMLNGGTKREKAMIRFLAEMVGGHSRDGQQDERAR